MKHIHMLGICGAGMGSLALLLKKAGYYVTGSDENVYPPISTQLAEAGIMVYKGYRTENLRGTRDACPPELEERRREGRGTIHASKNERRLPAEALAKAGATSDELPNLVIIGNVISRGNPEAEAVLAKGIPYMSMPQAVAEFFLKDKHPIVIAGTHGKTTTATLVAWLLEAAGFRPSFLIGGVGRNFGVSARLGHRPQAPSFKGGRRGPPLRRGGAEPRRMAGPSPPYFVIEGDEYDTAFFDKGPKFLHYRPRSVILEPIEFDHADIYRDLNHVMSSFEKLVEIIPTDGLLVACADNENVLKLLPKARCKVVTYGLSKKADYYPAEVEVSQDGTSFKLQAAGYKSPPIPPLEKGGVKPRWGRKGPMGPRPFSGHAPLRGVGGFILPIFGNHNFQNAVGALALLIELGLDPQKLAKGLATFKGVRRRLEILGTYRGITIIDDFAHHPTAVGASIQAVRSHHPSARLWAVFEPRSNTSRRKIFQEEFARALAKADEVIVAGLYRPEKVPEGERLDVMRLVRDITNLGPDARYIPDVDEIVEFIIKNASAGDIILIMSNGGFGNIQGKLKMRIANCELRI